jgi:protein-L-isoaspartate(D-aspartate) O-methyltransferase
MVQEQLVSRGIEDIRVLEAMSKVPRHLFVDAGMQGLAYNDHPVFIGEGQTISQPYIVAKMLQTLQIQPDQKILEIGTGCGYLTALLAELADAVYSIERIPNLLLKGRKNLKALGYKNITIRLGDGTIGWPEKGPFDAIVASAGSPQIPRPYLDQCSVGGKVVVPIGSEEQQFLLLLTHHASGWQKEEVAVCRFVKLKGKHGFISP